MCSFSFLYRSPTFQREQYSTFKYSQFAENESATVLSFLILKNAPNTFILDDLQLKYLLKLKNAAIMVSLWAVV